MQEAFSRAQLARANRSSAPLGSISTNVGESEYEIPSELRVLCGPTRQPVVAKVVNAPGGALLGQVSAWPGSKSAPWRLHSDDPRLYALVHSKKLLGLLLVDEVSSAGVLVQALDVAPDCRFRATNREYAYVGMALIVLAVKLSQQAGGDGWVGAVAKTSALTFYDDLGFMRGGSHKVFLYERQAVALLGRFESL